ncbi:MAG: Flp pilus assembly protein CpaB [Armatimonadia bacterium]|nr:Flp pilus assembly protein CpaB [Armatimonadia bacterium]
MTLRLTRRQAFAVAAIIALIVAGLVYFVLTQQTAPPDTEEVEDVVVLAAAMDIPAYTTVTGEMLGAVEMKSNAVPSGALSSPGDAIGKISQRQIMKGQTITASDVGARSAKQGLTFVIPNGMRAVTVALDPISGVGGFVFPGDRVDVLTTFEQNEVAMTRTILQNVEVLAMNEQVSRPTPSGGTEASDQGDGGGTEDEAAPAIQQVRSATLSVTPDEAQTLLLSAFRGAVHLALRPREDETMVSLSGQTNWSVMGMEPPEEDEDAQLRQGPDQPPYDMPPGAMWGPQWAGNGQPPTTPPPGQPQAQPEPEPAPTVEVIRGGDREVVPVP